jgi:hypothetical protein
MIYLQDYRREKIVKFKKVLLFFIISYRFHKSRVLYIQEGGI